MVPTRVQLLRWRVWLTGLLLAGTGVAAAAEFDADDWRILTPERTMTAEPRAPGAAAIYLYSQVDRDDEASTERVYDQIKILTEEGRGRANIEIRYDKADEKIRGIEARVVQPDGAIVPFNGTVYDRPIASGRDVQRQAKTFTLPEVRVGSIVEYRFTRQLRYDQLYVSDLVLSQELFTRFGRYSVSFYDYGNARWGYPNGLPEGTTKPVLKNRKLQLETRNVPAFVTEQHMPPANELRYLVECYYVDDDATDTDTAKFWKKFGKRIYKDYNRFADDNGAIRKALAGIVAPGDSPAQQVRKIYDHVQHMRNTTFEPELDEQEARRRKDRNANNATDVAKLGYGNSGDLRAYFLTLVRAAGIPAEPVLVGGRTSRFFKQSAQNSSHLDSVVVAVTLDGRDLLLDPGVPFLPFGKQVWSDTAVGALKLNADGGTWFTMPLPKPDDAVTARKAQLTLNSDGELAGTVNVTYTGHEALWRRMTWRNEDEQTRREFLEGDLKNQLVGAAQIKVLRQPDWAGIDAPLQVEYQIDLAEWAVASGNRLLVGLGIFGGGEKGEFVASNRVHPIYFNYPFRTDDEVQIVLPAGYRQQGAPDAWPAVQDSGLNYTTNAQLRDGTLVIRRELSVNALLTGRANYPRFRGFYEAVRAGDQQQLVLVR